MGADSWRLDRRRPGGHAVGPTNRRAAARYRRQRRERPLLSDFGAAAAINFQTGKFASRIQAITAGHGVDVVLHMVGGEYIAKNVTLLRSDGRLVLVAFLQGSRRDTDFMPVMLKRLRITGSTMRPRSVEEKAVICDALAREIWPALAPGRLQTPQFATLHWIRPATPTS